MDKLPELIKAQIIKKMINKLEVCQKDSDQTGNITATVCLFVALFPVSSAAILIRLSAGEIGPNAIVFNRVAIATIVFGFGNGLNAIRYRLSNDKPPQEQLNLSQDFWLLLAMAIFFILPIKLYALGL